MDAPFSGARRRTLLGLSLAVAFIPVLLGITACLETPIGDPEKGWVDPRISGVWLVGSNDRPEAYDSGLWVFEPYDKRTWLVTVTQFEDAGPPADASASGAAAAAGTETPGASAAAAPAGIETPATSAAAQPAAASAQPAVDVLRVLETLTEDRAKPSGVLLFKAWLTSIGAYRFLVLEPRLTPDKDRGLHPQFWLVYRVVLRGDQIELTGVYDETLKKARTRGEAEQYIAQHAAGPGLYDGSESTVLYRVPQSAYEQVDDAVRRAGLSDW